MRRARPHVDPLIESRIRQYLRDCRDVSYCARCLAAALLLEESVVRAAIGYIVGLGPFGPGRCHCCGALGLRCASGPAPAVFAPSPIAG